MYFWFTLVKPLYQVISTLDPGQICENFLFSCNLHRDQFKLQGVSLNGTGSTVVGVTVTLSDVNLFTTGLYGCEASADPSFHTELVRKHMTILGT